MAFPAAKIVVAELPAALAANMFFAMITARFRNDQGMFIAKFKCHCVYIFNVSIIQRAKMEFRSLLFRAYLPEIAPGGKGGLLCVPQMLNMNDNLL